MAIDQHNPNLKTELTDFQESMENTVQIESFICRGYLYGYNKEAQKLVNETAALNVTRYSLFTKKQFEGEKLPPTKSAFEYHLARAFFQVSIWSTAKKALVGLLLAGSYLAILFPSKFWGGATLFTMIESCYTSWGSRKTI